MARRIRLDAAGVAHHVMVRGLDGARIFFSVDDHQDFVDRLVRLLPECDARCFAWTLMPNHVHLVIQTQRGDLSRVMRRLNTGYAMRFNRSYERKGYLFQNRFRSRIVSGDADLIGLIRYVHLNPVEAGLVASPDALGSYPWCGHGALIGSRTALAFEAVAGTLGLFGDDPARARAALLAWMRRGAETGSPPTPTSMPAGAAAPVPDGFESQERIGLDDVLGAACARYDLTSIELRSGSKQPRIARARAAVAWVAVVELGISGRAVAAALGVTRTTVSSLLARGRQASQEDSFGSTSIQGAPLENPTIPNI